MYKEIGFSECDIMDGFFDSLKEDYPGFESWFEGKSRSGATAFVSKDEDGKVEAFVYVKDEECEAVGNLPAEPRMKIGTIKISPGSEGTRLGEGGIGLALWKWQRSPLDQIYLTVFPKQEKLIGLIERYGFVWKGDKGGERVYLKDKRELDYSDNDIPWLKSFPYLDPDFKRGVYIPIYAGFHDNMFAYSELSNTEQKTDPLPVANGVMKVYIATPYEHIDYRPKDVALVYRVAESETNKTYLSAVTSFCTVTGVEWFKKDGIVLGGKTFEDFVDSVGNKTVYGDDELSKSFKKRNVCTITLLYNGYFGEGRNVNHKWLESKGFFKDHPYKIILNPDQVRSILKEGGIDEGFAFIHKSRACREHSQRDQEIRVQEDQMQVSCSALDHLLHCAGEDGRRRGAHHPCDRGNS